MKFIMVDLLGHYMLMELHYFFSVSIFICLEVYIMDHFFIHDNYYDQQVFYYLF